MRPCSGGRNMSSLLPDLDALWYGDRFAMLNHGVYGERSFTVLFHHLNSFYMGILHTGRLGLFTDYRPTTSHLCNVYDSVRPK